MELSDKFYKSIIAEAMDEFAMLEKGGKDHPEDDNDHKKQGQKDTVSKSDQQLIRRKVKNKQGRNIINVTAIADELPYTQSMINRCINGKVHNGSQGEVEYKMPTDMARGIEAYLKRQVAEGKVAAIMKQVLNEKQLTERDMSYPNGDESQFTTMDRVHGLEAGRSQNLDNDIKNAFESLSDFLSAAEDLFSHHDIKAIKNSSIKSYGSLTMDHLLDICQKLGCI